jgi:hypothetical protein
VPDRDRLPGLKMGRAATHAVVWLLLFAFWLLLTRESHPSWALAATATATLTAASAMAVCWDWYVLRPAFVPPRRWGRYAFGLLAGLAALTFATVPLIQRAYDAAGIPVEVRIGYWANVGFEAAWYAVHVAAAALVRAIINIRRKRTQP